LKKQYNLFGFLQQRQAPTQFYDVSSVISIAQLIAKLKLQVNIKPTICSACKSTAIGIDSAESSDDEADFLWTLVGWRTGCCVGRDENN
jgi:hypothetical protein